DSDDDDQSECSDASRLSHLSRLSDKRRLLARLQADIRAAEGNEVPAVAQGNSVPSVTQGDTDATMTQAEAPAEDTQVNKGPNFKDWEDIMLVKSYINNTINSVAGTNQTSKVYWAAIKKSFDKCGATETAQGKEPGWEQQMLARDQDALKRRWATIQRRVRKYNVHYRWFLKHPPTGTPETEYKDKACKRYEQLEKGGDQKFKLKHVLDLIWQHMPNLSPYMDNDKPKDGEVVTVGDDEDEDNPLAGPGVNKISAGMGSGFKRPIGRDSAKKRKASAKGNTGTTIDDLSKISEAVAKGVGGYVAPMSVGLKIEPQTKILKERASMVMDIYKMYESRGDMEGMDKYMEKYIVLEEKLQGLDEKLQAMYDMEERKATSLPASVVVDLNQSSFGAAAESSVNQLPLDNAQQLSTQDEEHMAETVAAAQV
ncbi:MAG: hypothetical protein AAFN81_31545, partial [Bacteroidota bacterium]